MRLSANNSDILIIGGGASGLAAACVALERDKTVRVLEAQPRIGRKLLATGNGRCNLMNAGEPVYFGQSDFAREALRHCPQERVRGFFDGLGLNLIEEAGGLVYPASMQASSVLNCLRLPLESNANCDVLVNKRVRALHREGGSFLLRCEDGTSYRADRLIMAAGSPAQPKLSGADQAYGLLEALGHRVIPPRPALSALITGAKPVRGLKGLRVPVIATLCEDSEPLSRTEGELLFAQDGVSGVCVMQLSRDAGGILARGRRATLYLDFSPLLMLRPRRYQRSEPRSIHENREAVLRLLNERAGHLPAEALLVGLLPHLLAERLKGLPVPKLAEWLSAFPLPVTGVRGFEHAQVAAGGIDCDDIAPETMESRLIPGLHICGELLNVDGDCGGHNLLFAWASGLLAGGAAGKSLV